MKLLRRLQSLFRPTKLDAEMAEEMRAHLELQAAANEQQGMAADEAHYAASRAFGGVEQIKERAREQRGWTWLEGLLGDLRFAGRMLRRNAGFTAAVVLTLALGVGVNTGLFTLFDVFVLRPLPLHEADRLVNIAASHPRNGSGPSSFSYPDYLDYRARNHAFSDLIATRYEGQNVLQSDRSTASPADDTVSVNFVPVWFVSENYFSALRPQMALGQPFVSRAGVEAAAADAVIVLSYRCWQRQFNSDPAVVGATLRLNGQTLTIIGVAAADFTGLGLPPRPTIGWIPLTVQRGFADWGKNRKDRVLTLAGRLAPGVTAEQAAAELQMLRGQITSAADDSTPDARIVVWSGGTLLPKPPGAPWPLMVVLLLVAFAMVMTIACANVMNLLLARATARQQEIAVRLAAGATRGRLVRQLLTESLLLSLLGGVAGLFLGTWTLQALYAIVMSSVAVDPAVREWLTFNLGPDYRVFGFAFLLVLVAGLATGLTPALAASRADTNTLLQGGGSLFSGRISRSRLRGALVVLQVALSLTLLIGAGLLVRNVRRQTGDLGFDPTRTLALLPVPSEVNGASLAEWQRFVSDVEAKLAGVPGVAAVGRANFEILRTNLQVASIAPGDDLPAAADSQKTPFAVISPTYLATLGVPLLRGRTFTPAETAAAAPVVLVSDSLARRLWPGRDAIGQTLRVDREAFAGRATRGPDRPLYRTCEVIGVVRDAIYDQLLDANHACFFLPLSSSGAVRSSGAGFVLRTTGDPRATMGQLRAAVEQAGGSLVKQTPLVDSLAAQRAPAAAAALLSGAVGLLGLAVAAVGLFGVISFNVNRRVREIGIRVALGAAPRVIVRTFIGQGMRLVAIGIGVGLFGGFALARLIASALHGVRPVDPVAFGGVTLLLAGVALLACWLPARRAARVDPMVALRCE
jgi:predicted permease